MTLISSESQLIDQGWFIQRGTLSFVYWRTYYYWSQLYRKMETMTIIGISDLQGELDFTFSNKEEFKKSALPLTDMNRRLYLTVKRKHLFKFNADRKLQDQIHIMAMGLGYTPEVRPDPHRKEVFIEPF